MPLIYSVLWKVDGKFLTVTTPSVNYTDFYLDDMLANEIQDGSTVSTCIVIFLLVLEFSESAVEVCICKKKLVA